MIADFVTDRMTRYLAGGMKPETAAHFITGELEAVCKGNHYSRDKSGAMRPTPPPEALDPDATLKKCTEIISRKYPTLYHGAAAIKQVINAGIGIKFFFAKGADSDPGAYTTDLEKIKAMWKDGQRRFKAFIRGRFLVIDVDRKLGKPDGLETFYRLFPRETLPAELQDLPGSFPIYTATPSGGFHLYFRYEGPELKLLELAPSVEIKETQITCPGSRKEDNGEYILHGDLSNAPPLYGLLIDAIEEKKLRKEAEKEERAQSKKTKAAAHPAQFEKPRRITLDDLADEAIAAHAGNHDRQVSFSGRACRCKFSGADTLAYVKSRPDIFGNDSDTTNTILSVFRDYGVA